MIAIIRCKKCRKELKEIINVHPIEGVVVDVEPCKNVDCYDCSKCEVEQENKKLKEQLTKVKEGLTAFVNANI